MGASKLCTNTWTGLESQLSFEVIRVNNGNIRDNILQGRMPNGSRFLGIPAFLRNPDDSTGILKRQCTSEYKTRPIYEYLRSRLGLKPGRRAPRDVQVEMWLGISADEAIRQKPDREEWVTKRYPLVKLGFTRAQLINWFKKNYPGRELPSSSCIGLPIPYRWGMEGTEAERPEVIPGRGLHRPSIERRSCHQENS